MEWGCPEPELPVLPKRLEDVTAAEEMRQNEVELRVRMPRELDGMRGYFEVFYTAGLE